MYQIDWGIGERKKFGNIRPPAGYGRIAFLNLVKYPPSLTFLLMTLGVNLMLLSLLARPSPAMIRPFAIFGRVPLSFYLTHLYLYAVMGQWIDPAGIGIPRMIPYWLVRLAVLFPLCWEYGRYKNGRSPDSLWHFF